MKLEILKLRNRPAVLWGMAITDVDLTQHCKKCFVGTDIHGLSLRGCVRRGGNPFFENIELMEGKPFYYICSVSRLWIDSGFQSENLKYNTHLAFVPSAADVIEHDTETWRIRVSGAKEIPILKEYIPYDEPDPKFRECRNWQFGHYVYQSLHGGEHKV